mgnify:CR=1 FL=1
MVFAIACLGSMMAQNPLKSFLSALIGLGLATVGVDANTGVYRFTFDSVHLSDGVQFIVVVIGLFSVSEILLMLEHTSSGQTLVRKTGRMLFSAKEGAQCIGTTLRSSVIGFFVGILPGAGATIASAITYMTEKKLSGNSDSFGKGDIRGVAAPEAANNASACGSFIPMLTLGVPGSGTTAVMMGALTLYNITPGPAMFTEQPDIVWGLIAALLIANVMLLVMNIPLIGLFTRMLTIPLWFLVPAIAAVSAVGVYAVHSTTFDLVLMVVLGVLGYILRKMHFPMSPLILGFVLGEMLEQNLRRALSISNGNMSILWDSSVAKVLLALAIMVIVVPPVLRLLRRRQRKPEPDIANYADSWAFTHCFNVWREILIPPFFSSAGSTSQWTGCSKRASLPWIQSGNCAISVPGSHSTTATGRCPNSASSSGTINTWLICGVCGDNTFQRFRLDPLSSAEKEIVYAA